MDWSWIPTLSYQDSVGLWIGVGSRHCRIRIRLDYGLGFTDPAANFRIFLGLRCLFHPQDLRVSRGCPLASSKGQSGLWNALTFQTPRWPFPFPYSGPPTFNLRFFANFGLFCWITSGSDGAFYSGGPRFGNRCSGRPWFGNRHPGGPWFGKRCLARRFLKASGHYTLDEVW